MFILFGLYKPPTRHVCHADEGGQTVNTKRAVLKLGKLQSPPQFTAFPKREIRPQKHKVELVGNLTLRSANELNS